MYVRGRGVPLRVCVLNDYCNRESSRYRINATLSASSYIFVRLSLWKETDMNCLQVGFLF